MTIHQIKNSLYSQTDRRKINSSRSLQTKDIKFVYVPKQDNQIQNEILTVPKSLISSYLKNQNEEKFQKNEKINDIKLTSGINEKGLVNQQILQKNQKLNILPIHSLTRKIFYRSVEKNDKLLQLQKNESDTKLNDLFKNKQIIQNQINILENKINTNLQMQENLENIFDNQKSKIQIFKIKNETPMDHRIHQMNLQKNHHIERKIQQQQTSQTNYIQLDEQINIGHQNASNERNSQYQKEKLDQDVVENPSIKQYNYMPLLNNKYKFCVQNGNNPDIIKRIMNKRGEFWQESNDISSLFNLKWTNTSKNIKWDQLIDSGSNRQLINHLENHTALTLKENLIKSLEFYCENHQYKISQITPPSFVIDFQDENIEGSLKSFIDFYNNHLPSHIGNKSHNTNKTLMQFRQKLRPYYQQEPIDFNKNQKNKYTKPHMSSTMKGPQYMWILKPSGYNRGIGIHIFKNLQELNNLLIQYLEGFPEKTVPKQEDSSAKKEEIIEDKVQPNIKNISKYFSNQPLIIRSKQFVIQKYIEKPFLIYQRKFDIRVWVLVDNNLDAYFFKEGYLRLSSYKYNLDDNDVQNTYIHLTNNAIQKNCKDYGKQESGNQMSFSDFDSYLKNNNISLSVQDIVHNMKEIATITLQSDKKSSFELFGYDFMIDEMMKLHLIEINTNPCIEESSNLLKMILPRMIDDLFKLTIDKTFPLKKPMKDVKSVTIQKFVQQFQETQNPQMHHHKCKSEQTQQQSYPVNGYDDNQNLWDIICSLRSSSLIKNISKTNHFLKIPVKLQKK